MKTPIYTALLFLFFGNTVESQVLIASKTSTVTSPDPSAVLHVEDDKKGVLFPQVPLLSNTDNVTVPTPVQGLVVYNTTAAKLDFWDVNKWNRLFGIDDGLAIIKTTANFSGVSGASSTVSVFPATMPLFNLDDSPTGWTNTGASATITITKATNANFIETEGMAQINNDTASNQEFQFAIGVFVDGKLKIARKYTAIGKNFVCNWRKFNLAGVFNDLPVGNHTISIYGRNLPQVTSGYTSITYGGNTSNCNNINDDMARIFVTAQVTQ